MKGKDIVSDIVSRVRYAVIATVDENGQPWNTPVFVSVDTKLNVFWDSRTDSQHSQNIQKNSRVFIVLFDSGAASNGKTKQGVYIKATAEMVKGEENLNYYAKLRSKIKPIENAELEFTGASPKRIYKATPDKLWVNDRIVADGKKIDVRSEVPLP
jgi:general stress protein 26